MESPLIKRIHVNQHHIRHNTKNPDDLKDVITVKTSKANHYGSDVVCNGATRVIYSPHKPLSCGAKVWIEALGDVTIIDKDNNTITV